MTHSDRSDGIPFMAACTAKGGSDAMRTVVFGLIPIGLVAEQRNDVSCHGASPFVAASSAASSLSNGPATISRPRLT